MNKKFISVIMAAILAVSASAVCVSAAEVEEETAGAEVTAEASKESGTFFFDSGDWKSENICFYIWDGTAGEYAKKDGWFTDNKWGSKKWIGGTKVEGKDGVFESYEVDFSGREDHSLYVIFHDPDTGAQTFDCVINSSAFNHTATRDGNIYENPEDSDKRAEGVRFDGGDGLGVAKVITSTGKIQGDLISDNVDRADTVANFVYKYLGSEDKNTHEQVVTEATVADAISQFGTTADDVWAKYLTYKDKEDAGEYYKEAEAKKVIKPTEDSDSDSDSSSSSSSSSSSTTSSKSSTGTTTTGGSTTTTTTTDGGSTDTASTGDTRGVVAFAAVLVAAAGTIVATRKKIED